MSKRIRTPTLVAALAVAALVGGPAAGHQRHHRPVVAAAPPAPSAAAHSFYPETVEGGVPGNLSFNNQLRKFSDPLNANGGR